MSANSFRNQGSKVGGKVEIKISLIEKPYVLYEVTVFLLFKTGFLVWGGVAWVNG
ncbi:MAG: hypothetical protein QGG38_07635 [Nitrospinaceae bacterium]|jgi:hypothetical protein|nr:hypothetical protein [Nitrospinaceae bacterium]MDP6712542.1 hypothetical protein [Nitrospinaceae bacterium]MDP7058080.1 hypothetical protein [Nitrospinaceae bacterium]